MNIGSKIKELRVENNLTQKQLAEKLFVTPQALSKWENGENEPSLSVVAQLAEIFNVSLNEVMGVNEVVDKKETNKVEENDVIPSVVILNTSTKDNNIKEEKEIEQKPVLAVCERCNRPIYNGDEIVRFSRGHHKVVYCKECDETEKALKKMSVANDNKKARIKSYIWGAIITAVVMAIALGTTITLNLDVGIIVGSAFASLLVFPFVSCLFLDNNFIAEVVMWIIEFGFVTFPGIIFTFDLDGFIFLIAMKILFAILSAIFVCTALFVAGAVGIVLSLFVYPFSMYNSFRHPEKFEG